MGSGGDSATQINTPLEFLIKTPDSVEATDFQLVHLHHESDAREFRTVTGGVFHASGGSSRDRIAFDQTRIAKRTYKVALPANLPVLNMDEIAFLNRSIVSTASVRSQHLQVCSETQDPQGGDAIPSRC
jgi:hypothetical protein